MLIDRFNRVHDYLRISLTDKCNLRCAYCMPVDLPRGFYNGTIRMEAEEILTLAKLFVQAGVRKIRLTGGEPLVRKDAARIMRDLSTLNVELTLTTNGVYVDEFTGVFRESGIRSVNVSLDSLEGEKFQLLTKRNYFDRIMANIDLLLKEGFRVKVNMVVLKDLNHTEIPRFVAWTKSHPLHVRFIEYMPFTGNGWSHLQVYPAGDVLKLIAEHTPYEKIGDDPHDTARHYRAVGHTGTFALINTMSQPFCSTCNRMRLTADGKMKNCLFSKGEVDLLSALRNGEDPEPLIRLCVQHKEKERGGQLVQDFNQVQPLSIRNRSMVAIGG